MSITQINRSPLVERRAPRHAALPIALAVAIAGLALSQSAIAQVAATQLPTGGSIAGGTGTINAPSGASQVITQTSNRMALNWSTFDIGSAATVTFNQPSSSAVVLNQVQGGNPTQIFGNLNANGQVFLINQNGMIFGSTAQINVGGLVASTLGTTASAFMSGNDVLDAGGNTVALMSNAGTINAAAGAVDLIGGKVANSGTITASAGNINLVGADKVTLSFESGGFAVVIDKALQLQLDQFAVDNSGSVIAPGGTISLSARAARGVFDSLVNNSGVVRAAALSGGSDGSVSLVANGGSSNGIVGTGTIDVGSGAISYVSDVGVQQGGVLTAGTVVGSIGGNASFSGANRIVNLAFLGVSGNLGLTNTIDLAQQGALTVGGTSNFSLGSQALTLTDAGNDFSGAVSLTSGATRITDSGALTLGTLSTGNLIATSNGALNLGGGAIGGSLTASSGNGAITQAGALNVAGAATVNAGSGAITLDNAANDFGGSLRLTGTGIRVRDRNDLEVASLTNGSNGGVDLRAGGALDLPTQNIDTGTGALGLVADGGALSTKGSLSGGNISLRGRDGITLSHGIAATGTLGLTAVHNAIVQIAGALNVGAMTTIDAGTGAIALEQAGNDFGGVVSLTGGSARLADVNALTLGASQVAGLLRVHSGGDLRLAGVVRAADADLGAGGLFRNDAGAGALDVSGRWHVYLAAPSAGHVFGGLDSGNTAVWNTAALGAVPVPGNRYVFAFQPTLRWTSTNLSKIYGDSIGVDNAFAVSGLMPGVSGAYRDDVLGNVVTGAPALSSAGSAATAPVAGGPYAIQIAQGTLDATGSGYALAFDSSGRLTVDRAGLTVTAADAGKTYGQTTTLTGYRVDGLRNTDAVSAVNLASAGTMATANVGDYTITAANADGTGLSNYDITYVDGVLSVGKAGLTITAANAAKTYGQAVALTGYTVDGLRNADAVSSLDLTSAGTVATANVGDYTITAANADGTGLSNYDITYVDGVLSVGKAGLTITAANAGKTYGQTATLSGYSVDGLMNADSVTAVDLASPGTVATANVGDYTITAANADGTGLSNYDITYVDGVLSVGKAGLTITAANAGKTYGQTATLSGYSVEGLMNADSVAAVDLASPGTVATANVGDYTISATNADGTGLSNYAITYVDGVLQVCKAGLTITAANAGKTYGQNPALRSYRVDGLQNSDSVSSVDLRSAGTVATANVGDYTITASNADGTGLSNYDIRYVDGVLSVGKAGLTITAADGRKTYGQASTLRGYAVTGLLNADRVAAVDLASTGTAATASVGNYTITARNADGTGLSNYDISYVDGVLSVGKAGLTITANDAFKRFGTVARLDGYRVDGLVNADAVTALTLTSDGTPAAAGRGTYAIQAGDAGGAGLSNYEIAYVDGTLTVGNAAAPQVATTIAQATRAAAEPVQDATAATSGPGEPQIIEGGVSLPVQCDGLSPTGACTHQQR